MLYEDVASRAQAQLLARRTAAQTAASTQTAGATPLQSSPASDSSHEVVPQKPTPASTFAPKSRNLSRRAAETAVGYSKSDSAHQNNPSEGPDPGLAARHAKQESGPVCSTRHATLSANDTTGRVSEKPAGQSSTDSPCDEGQSKRKGFSNDLPRSSKTPSSKSTSLQADTEQASASRSKHVGTAQELPAASSASGEGHGEAQNTCQGMADRT
jgi:hypothetical protein